MKADPNSRLRPMVTWLPMLSSLFLFVQILAFAAHVRLGLGHWPKPMVENYNTLASRLHFLSLIGMGLFAVWAAIPLWLLMLCVRPLRVSWPVHLKQLTVYAVGWLMIAIYCLSDPEKFVTWVMD